MNKQCEFCIHNDVCAYKEHYEDAVKLYEKARDECGKYPWFTCDIVCVKYRKAESYDAISRAYIEPIIEELEDICDNSDEYILNLLADIKNAPPVTPSSKTGHWIKQTLSVKPFGEDTVLCDQCAFMTDKDNTYNYCPNCGAKMESET